MTRSKPSSIWFKAALLSISMMLMIAPNIAAALPLMAKTFSDQSASAVDTLSTIPNLGIILGIVLGNVLATQLGAKRTVLTGLAVALLSGLVPVVSNSYYVVLAARLIFGIAVGTFNSLAISLISDYYRGDELAAMMGYQSALSSLGSSLLSFAVGYLLLFGWHATFLIYAIALPIMILFGLVMPNDQPAPATKDTAQTPKAKQHINAAVILISLLTFFIYVFFMVVTIKLAGLLTANHLGTASQASAILGGFTLVTMLMGLLFGRIYKLLQNKILPLGFILMAIGFYLVSTVSSLAIVAVGTVIIGIGFAVSIPYIYTIINVAAPANSKNLDSSVMLIMTNVGVFLSPTIVNALASLTGKDEAAGSMVVASIGFLILAVIVAAVVISQKRTKPTVQETN